jgi:hypothetical protein
VAEGGGLLNRYTASSRIVSSNLIPSASICNFLIFNGGVCVLFEMACATCLRPFVRSPRRTRIRAPFQTA